MTHGDIAQALHWAHVAADGLVLISGALFLLVLAKLVEK